MNILRLREDMPREQWLRLRKRGIGGSDAGVILGVSPYRSVLELYEDKISNELTDEPETEATYWGNLMEPIVREEFAKRSGLKVHVVPYLLQNKEYTFMQANLDGMVHDPVYGKCIFEAKTSSAYKKEEWDRGIPDTYYAQLQHYMAVTGWNGAYIAALIGGNEFIYRFVPRDDQYIEDLIVKEEVFWEHVKLKQMPYADGAKTTGEYIKNAYPIAKTDTVLELNEDSHKWLVQYYQSSSELKEVTRKKAEAENNLKQLVGSYESARIDNNVISWPNVISQRLDTERLKLEQPDIYQAYLKESYSRRFSVKCG